MLQRFRSKPSPTTVIACLALFFAVAGGSAIALKGKNSVDSGDIKKNAVKTADIAAKNVKNADIAANAVNGGKIKNASVGSGDLAANSVGSSQLQDGGVATVDLAGAEAFHRVGAAGEPAFGNGGQGDCIYSKLAPPGLDVFTSPGFYKDPYDKVTLTGAITNTDGSGGDAACDGDDLAESILFTLPAAYRPPKLLVMPSIQFGTGTELTAQLIIGSTADVVAGPTTIPAGAVIATSVGATDGDQAVLDGIDFRASGAGNNARRGTIQATGDAAKMINELVQGG